MVAVMRVAAAGAMQFVGDAVAAEVAGDDAGHAGDAALGGAVVGLAGVADEAGDGGEVDDAAAALLAHEDRCGLDQAEVTLEVGLDHRVATLRATC